MNLSKFLLAAIFASLVSGTCPVSINAAGTSDVKKSSAKKQVLDINSATADELKELPGISNAYAKKIIDSRPYNRKIELVQKQIISQAAFDKIKDQIVAKKSK